MGSFGREFGFKLMESVLKRRSPHVNMRLFCKAKMHAARSNDLQEILSEEALQKLQLCFGERNLMPLKLHDLVCKDCRKEASRSAAALSPVPSRRSEAMDLVATSPIATAETAIALQFAPPLSSTCFSELNASHPWFSRSPESVTADLMNIPVLALTLQEMAPLRLRGFLSGIGQAMQAHLDGLAKESACISTKTFAGFSSVVEAEFALFCRELRDLEPFARGSWERVEGVLNSCDCDNLRDLLCRLISAKGSERNFGRQSAPVKLRKVGLVLLQLGKLRSERFSGFAIKFSTYLHFRGVADDVSLLEIQLGLTVDPNTRRDALAKWRTENALKPVESFLLEAEDRVAFVGDNVNVFVGVRDIAAGVKAKQLNMFATALWLRELPSSRFSGISPLASVLSFRVLMLDAAGYSRVHSLLTWAAQDVLTLRGVVVDGPVPERPHVGQLGPATWIPFHLCERDSSRPAEMVEILKDLVHRLQLDRAHVWPFYGDMLTCRNVATAGLVLNMDSARPARFQPEFGLFHCQMAVVQRLLFKHFEVELREAAQKLGLKTLLKVPEKNYNTFERVCSGATAAYVGAVYDKTKTVESTVDVLLKHVLQPVASKSGRASLLTALLLVNYAWKKLVALADGEGIFDLIRFLLPFLATLGSAMYFRFLCTWVLSTINMSPYDRALRLGNMFVNRRGGHGQAKEVDLEFEYLVCSVKRMARPLPHVTPEFLERIVRDVPLYEQLREEVDITFKPAESTKYRSVRKNNVAIDELLKRVLQDFENTKVEDGKPSPKKWPLLFCLPKFEKKVKRIVSGSVKFDKEDAAVVGEEEASLDEIEQELL
jgi:hypothetical protein